MFYLDQIFYKFTINLTKLSILTLYLRIFTQPWFVRTCWSVFALVSCYAIASILATVFQCTPINYYWDKHPPSISPPTTTPAGVGPPPASVPHCINATAFWLANAIYNISTDVVILTTLPFMIWSLRLPTPQKIGLTFVFGLGIFVFATSVLRLTTLQRGSQAKDVMMGTIMSTMWTMIEASAAVVCACLPMCRTPLQRVWPRLLRSRYGSAGGLQTQEAQTQTPRQGSGSRTLGNDSPRTMGGRRVDIPRNMRSGNGNGNGRVGHGGGMLMMSSSTVTAGTGPREMSGGMLAGHRGPGGRTMSDDGEDFSDDLEMQSTEGDGSGGSRSRDETDQKGIIGGVVPVRMKGW
jgi:hypothetical protein